MHFTITCLRLFPQDGGELSEGDFRSANKAKYMYGGGDLKAISKRFGFGTTGDLLVEMARAPTPGGRMSGGWSVAAAAVEVGAAEAEVPRSKSSRDPGAAELTMRRQRNNNGTAANCKAWELGAWSLELG
jgi:hypothetical protein